MLFARTVLYGHLKIHSEIELQRKKPTHGVRLNQQEKSACNNNREIDVQWVCKVFFSFPLRLCVRFSFDKYKIKSSYVMQEFKVETENVHVNNS
jgi:hypothetical protein